MPRRPKVIVAIGRNRRILDGIIRYVHEHGWWDFHFVELGRSTADMIQAAREWPADGLITFLGPDRLRPLRAVWRGPIAAVTYHNGSVRSRLVRIMVDENMVGQLVARHLLDRGLRQFAFCGQEPNLCFQHRWRAYSKALGTAGRDCRRLWVPITATWVRRQAVISRWLAALPRPTGVMCSDDLTARDVLYCCERLGLRVPDEIAVVGVDNDPACDLCPIPLSSVDTNAVTMGYQAAAGLDAMMAGKRRPDSVLIVPPVGVVVRASSDTVAVKDPAVRRAVAYIRAHANDRIVVPDMLREVLLSRRTLERKFRQAVGHTIKAEIMLAGLERAKDLLTQTDLKVPLVATRSGFPRPSSFYSLFRREVRMTPTQYRASTRKG
ncbi:MAG: substrate-binding domain-containing protein [Phycisphaerae bacterium]